MKDNSKKLLVFLTCSMSILFANECLASQLPNPSFAPSSQYNHVRLVEYYDDECPHCHRMGSIPVAFQNSAIKLVENPSSLFLKCHHDTFQYC